MFLDYNSTSW